jgi:hypothetical protein
MTIKENNPRDILLTVGLEEYLSYSLTKTYVFYIIS